MAKLLFASADVGNDGLKGIFGEEKEKTLIPNVVMQDPARNVVEYESNPLQGLHVEIVSKALSQGKGVYSIGELATKYRGNSQPNTDIRKYQNDQTVILALTYLAYQAALTQEKEENIVKVEYLLSTGLPLSDAEHRKEFKEKLKTGSHTVTFLKTPELEGITVQISFKDVLVGVEGFSAYADLLSSPKLKDKLKGATVLINDIGGLSTDSAIIEEDGMIDNSNSKGINEGAAPYLDEISELVEKQYGYKFKSRAELVKVLTNKDENEKNHIYVKSNRTSIKEIVEPILTRFAKREYQHISKLWDLVPSIRFTIMIGGGSLILKPYIETLNSNGSKFVIEFLESDESIWAIANAYYSMLLAWAKQKRIQLIEKVEKEEKVTKVEKPKKVEKVVK